MTAPWISRALALLLLIGTSLWVYLGGAPERPASTTTSATQEVLVETQQTQTERYTPTFQVPGTTRANAQSLLTLPQGGIVAEILVKRGDSVAAQTPLLRMDATQQQADLQQAQASLQTAQARLDRTQTLAESGTTTQAALDEATETLSRAQATLVMAEQALENRVLKAPFAGEITDILVDTNTEVGGATPLIEMINRDPLYVDAFLSEREIAMLDPDQPVRFSGGEARVSFLSPLATPTRTRPVELTTTATLPAGAGVMLTFAGKPIQATQITLNTLVIDANGAPAVFLVQDDTAHLVPVDVLSSTDITWVTGIPDNSAVVVKGQNALVDGTPIRQEP